MAHILNCPVVMQNDGDEMIQQRLNRHLENPVNYKRTSSKIPSRCDGLSFYGTLKSVQATSGALSQSSSVLLMTNVFCKE